MEVRKLIDSEGGVIDAIHITIDLVAAYLFNREKHQPNWPGCVKVVRVEGDRNNAANKILTFEGADSRSGELIHIGDWVIHTFDNHPGKFVWSTADLEAKFRPRVENHPVYNLMPHEMRTMLVEVYNILFGDGLDTPWSSDTLSELGAVFADLNEGLLNMDDVQEAANK